MNVNINTESNETQQQNVGFSDQNQQWTYSIDNTMDEVHETGFSDDATLQNFFSRPIKIASINWTVGSTFSTTINPWQDYFENLRVINRLTNYNLMHAKLCVRIMINGNGFHYGRALASYRPLYGDDELPAWRFIIPEDTIQASQRMHCWIDPTKNQGGTLCLPFVWYKNALNIPDQEWREMGELDIASVTTLEHANGGTDAVTLSVFAWAEDVRLSIPTTAEPGSLAPQSVLEPQAETYTGSISQPASVLARASGMLAQIPAIKPFALATQFAANGIAEVSRAFGMSRPLDDGPLHQYRPSFVGNLANSNVGDTCTKLTYDVKSELTCDPAVTGVGHTDEMSIVSIAKRESYLTQFGWSTADTPESLLWNCYVTPELFDFNAAGTTNEFHQTPMCYVTQPFGSWRGTIRYRFQIVASSFHKGRLKIVYDPKLSTSSEYNVQYTHVIDLAKERDFTVDISWGQNQSYLSVAGLSTNIPFQTTPLGTPGGTTSNGVIAVYVVNDLTTPSATLSDVSVLVSTMAHDDFEVVNPAFGNVSNYTFFPTPGVGRRVLEPQSDLSSGDQDLTTAESSPIVENDSEIKLAAPLSVSDKTQLIYFADPVTSIRQVLKRYCFHSMLATNANVASPSVFVSQVSSFPVNRGYCSTSRNNAATPVDPTPFNYTELTMMNYFTPLFLCRRGGIRWKLIYSGTADSQQIMNVVRANSIGNELLYEQRVTTDLTSPSALNVSAKNGAAYFGHNGAVVTPVHKNPALEFEFPFFTVSRFAHGRVLNFNSTTDQRRLFTLRHPASVGDGLDSVQCYVAGGEDYSLSFFQATPTVYRTNDPTPSALF